MDHKPGTHWDTPKKARLHAAAQLIDSLKASNPDGTYPSRRQLFKKYNVSEATGRRILKQKDPRRLTNSNIRPETRGRKTNLTQRDIRFVELILWQGGFDGRELTWDSLAQEANLGVCGRTLQRHLNQLNYRRYLTYSRS